MKMYGLMFKDTKHLAGFSTFANDGNSYCVDVQYSLDRCYYPLTIWLVGDKNIAEKAAITNTQWFNAGYETPCNDYVGHFEVVEVHLTIHKCE